MNFFPRTILFASALLSGVFALAVLVPAKRSIARWCFAAGMLLIAADGACGYATLGSISAERAQLWQTLSFFAKCCLPATWVCFSVAYSRGNSLDFLRRARSLLTVGALLPFLAIVSLWWLGPLLFVAAVPPAGSTWWFEFSAAAKLLNAFFLVGTVLILTNLERTFRAAVGTMQWRIKFLVLGLAVIFGVRIYTQTQALLFSGYGPALFQIDAAAVVIGCLFMAIGYVRAGFSEIDVYPSRTVLHTSFTVVLAGGYLFVVGVLAQLVARRGEAGNFHLHAVLILVAVALLAVLLLSNRARQVTQRFISRHFRRPQHDFRRVWELFTHSVSAQREEKGICSAAVEIISSTVNAMSVSLWLFDEQREHLSLAASTARADETSMALPSSAPTPEEANGPADPAQPFDLEKSKAAWADSVRSATKSQFRSGGNRLCVPLRARDRWLGLLVLADRVGGLTYSSEESDLLQCIGNQVATSLLNAKLTAEVLVGKEMEAFRTMSAFFVHDLKNVTSTLTLMLQNLPSHFDDPVFRHDALRGIGKTVNRIDELIRRLGALRHKVEIDLAPVDLNEVVDEAIRTNTFREGVKVVRTSESVREITADRNQLQSIIVNLLMNAADSIGDNGAVKVQTTQRGNWVAVVVSDNGRGMTEDFLRNSLFRPFQSTKTNGLGIGMFQSKQIAEAHGGSIQVKSEVGTGTTFRLLLPLDSK